MSLTTTSTAAAPTELVRCALCKIDLRGRFVYIDDETEALLGRPREDLFGRSIMDILDLNSQPVIDHILSERNHYESHFDYAPLTLICNDGRLVTVEATMSLCFHGGNPVNFQLILKPYNISVRSIDDAETGLSVERFIEHYLETESSGRIHSLAVLLREFSGAEMVAVYLISDGGLEPRSIAGADSETGFTFEAIPDCTDLHRRVARSGGEYSATDKSAVRALAETGAAAPCEYVSTLSLDDGGYYLLRFVFSDRLAEDVLAGAVRRARLARLMVERLSIGAPSPTDAEDPDIDVKFTVGFLSSLGIGAFLTDSTGEIIGYNPAIADLLGGVELGPTCQDFVSLLDPDNGSGLAELISQHSNEAGDGDIRVYLSLPSGVECLLVIIRLAENEGDQSACWVLMPQASADRSPADGGAGQPAWQSLIEGLRPVLDEITAGAEQLSRDYCRQAGQLDHLELSRLHDAVRTLDEMHDYGSILQACSLPGDVAPIDLNELVDRTLDQLQGEFCDVVITCDHDDLPAIKSSHGRLSAVLRNLMANCVRHNPDKEVRIRVAVDIKGQQCQITVSDRGVCLPNAEMTRLFDFYLPPAASGEVRRSGGVGLGLSRELLRGLGGSIKATSMQGGGAHLAITLPLTSKNRGRK